MTSKIKLANITARFPFILFYEGDFKESPTVNIINIVERHGDENFADFYSKNRNKKGTIRFTFVIINNR